MDFNHIPDDPTLQELCHLGEDVLDNEHMQLLRTFHQHGNVTRYEHCLSVCYIALKIADRLRIRVNRRAMVRGALLHDFFLYDWHDRTAGRMLHGFTHAGEALKTAQHEFALNSIERDVIARHMFPLNITPPRCREALIVSLADKISATMETLDLVHARRIIRLCRVVGF